MKPGKQTPLPRSFYDRSVHDVAPDLIGCRLMHDGVGGIIVETEAYNQEDPACHAYRGPTERNRVMFGLPGRAYVYFSYGMHNLFNIVCEHEGKPAAVLIRALEPTEGIDEMRRRRAAARDLHDLTNGPGKLTQALAIDLSHYGRPVYRGALKLYGRSADCQEPGIIATPRIGIRTGTRRKWRYCAADSKYLSRRLTRKER
ncbi:MAG: DNA-3-methyladenine glycosylase [Thermoleophilia bacterium]|nr:DNA-3-methyladenine glycosylase [Thermoleophilia bacterium]